MNIFFPKEQDDESRTAIVPPIVEKYVELGAKVLIEAGAGKSSWRRVRCPERDWGAAWRAAWRPSP